MKHAKQSVIISVDPMVTSRPVVNGDGQILLVMTLVRNQSNCQSANKIKVYATHPVQTRICVLM